MSKLQYLRTIPVGTGFQKIYIKCISIRWSNWYTVVWLISIWYIMTSLRHHFILCQNVMFQWCRYAVPTGSGVIPFLEIELPRKHIIVTLGSLNTVKSVNILIYHSQVSKKCLNWNAQLVWSYSPYWNWLKENGMIK